MKENNTSNNSKIFAGIIIFIVIASIIYVTTHNLGSTLNIFHSESNTFRLLSSTSTAIYDEELIDYASKNGIYLEITHQGDLAMVDTLNNGTEKYDGVWISNSIWLYMLDNSYLVSNSKSIAIDPVIMGIKKSKAEELGFTSKDIYNKDILNAIKENKLDYVMTSVTETNTGATAYLGFLNSIAGSPEVLTEEMLDDKALQEDLKSFFKGVERVSGNEEYIKEMFLKGEYNAVITYESSLIDINKELEKNGEETLYFIYPKDGVAINDMPFAFIDNGTGKEELFNKLQNHLRSDEAREKLESLGFRTWYGGTNENPNKVFKKDWGIDTTKYLIPLKYPSKPVMNKAFDLYVTSLRKPTAVVFVLDVSGSMAGGGIEELQDSLYYLLDYEKASKDRLQFSEADQIKIITFNEKVDQETQTYSGRNTEELINFVREMQAYGGTNIYDSSVKALEDLKSYDKNEYTRTVILMTDGKSNVGEYDSLEKAYKGLDIPIYSITFGNADDYQLQTIADLTNGKVFDGKTGLKEAFQEVRSYS